MFERTGFLLQLLGRAQPCIPDRRVVGVLGKFAVSDSEIAKFLCLIHARTVLSGA